MTSHTEYHRAAALKFFPLGSVSLAVAIDATNADIKILSVMTREETATAGITRWQTFKISVAGPLRAKARVSNRYVDRAIHTPLVINRINPLNSNS
jgi:hypothetical protein